jgi:hypothetical protein
MVFHIIFVMIVILFGVFPIVGMLMEDYKLSYRKRILLGFISLVMGGILISVIFGFVMSLAHILGAL